MSWRERRERISHVQWLREAEEERLTAEFPTELSESKEFFRSMVVVSGVLDFFRRRSGLEGFETGSIVYN